MALDNTTLKTIQSQLLSELDGAFLERPYALNYTHIAIPYHSGNNAENKGRGTLIIALDGENPFIVYSFDKFTKINDNSPFLNSLRKLQGTRIRNIKKAPGERVITISSEVKDVGIDVTDTGFDLIIELFPMHPNAYLVSYPYGKVVSAFKDRGDLSLKGYNGRGLKYSYPPLRTEVNSNLKSLEEIKPLLSRATYKHFEQYANKVGFEKALDDLINSKSLYLINEKIEPLSFDNANAQKIDINNIYSHYVSDQRKQARILKDKELIDTINKSLRIANKKMNNLEKDYSDAQKNLKYVDYGQLLYMAQADYVPGMKEIEVEGTTIPLDNKLTLVENANRYFKKYRKAKQAITTLAELINKTKYEITYLEKKRLDIENGSARDLMELKEELVINGYLKGKSQKSGKKQKSIKKKSYEPHYLNIGNAKIGFGLNDLQNETLTFEISRSNSLFFHVKDHPGSHVVILNGQDDNNIRTIACELALYLSHQKDGDVMYTEKRFVKKNKDKTGLVNILEYNTYTIKKIREESIELFKKELD